MGKQINKILSQVSSLNPDLIFLQECDLLTQRCHFNDILAEISISQNMTSLFTVESIVKNQNKTLGYCGNAILSKYDFTTTQGIIINCGRYPQHPHKSKTHNEAFCIIKIPNIGNIGCYSIHLDPHWSGIQGRIKQYNEILIHLSNNKYMFDYIIICGDLNTVCNGLNRLVPSIGCDYESVIKTLGKSEAEYFNENAIKKLNVKYGLDLYDCFDKNNDTTLCINNGIFKAKADWILLSANIKVKKKLVNSPFNRCSDHQWLLVDVSF